MDGDAKRGLLDLWRPSMVTITLPSELERAVAEEAARKGTTAERLTLDVLQERFLDEHSAAESPTAIPAPLRERLEALLDLQDGWNGYSAPPPHRRAVNMASAALVASHGMLSAPERVAPSAVGGVGITFRRGTRKAYLECYNNGQVVLLLSDVEAEQLQTCKIDPTMEGFSQLPLVIMEYLDGGIA
jgi:hypothetical protein